MGLLSARGIILNRGDFTLGPIDISLLEGTAIAIAGRNGSGKTTLLEGLSGALPLHGGELSLLHEDDVFTGKWNKKRYRSAAQMIGVQLQDIHLFDLLTVSEHISFFADLYGVGTETYLQLVANCPALHDQGDKKYSTLSAGKRQLLHIILAIGHGPKLVFLDEPTSGIDDDNKEWLWTVLENIKRKGGGIVFSSHEGREMDALGEHLLVLEDGAPAFFSSKDNAQNTTGYKCRIVLAPLQTTPHKEAHDLLRSLPGVHSVKKIGDRWIVNFKTEISEAQKYTIQLGKEWDILETCKVGLHDVYQVYRERTQ